MDSSLSFYVHAVFAVLFLHGAVVVVYATAISAPKQVAVNLQYKTL